MKKRGRKEAQVDVEGRTGRKRTSTRKQSEPEKSEKETPGADHAEEGQKAVDAVKKGKYDGQSEGTAKATRDHLDLQDQLIKKAVEAGVGYDCTNDQMFPPQIL